MTDTQNKKLEVIQSKMAKAARSDHPLKSGLSGMDDFAYLYFLTADESPYWIETHLLPDIYRLIDAKRSCTNCCGKMIAFGMKFCGRLPEHNARLSDMFKRYSNVTTLFISRNYGQEVAMHIDRFKEEYQENAWKYPVLLTPEQL